MAWTDQQWDTFAGLLEDGWPGEFDDRRGDAYRLLLDAIEPADAVRGLQVLLRTSRFRPSAAEIVQAVEHDPSRPTFDEAYRLIFGPRGILAARPAVTRWADEAERRRLYNRAARDRAAELHPLVGAFVDRQGIDRLRELPVDDPDYGELRRKDLRQQWDEHVQAFAGREIHALAAGDDRQHGLRRLDPLAAIQPPAPMRPELEPGAAVA